MKALINSKVLKGTSCQWEVVQHTFGKMKVLEFPFQTYACTMYQNSKLSEILQTYRHNYDPNAAGDIFSGNLYQTMLRDGAFQSPKDLALGLFIDGFS